MKNLMIFILCIGLHFTGLSQISVENDLVTPFNGDIAAVKKDGKWGFINKSGKLIVNYRNDYVLTKNDNSSYLYPFFNNERCLIRKLINGVYYYGYIDQNGKEIIPLTYLNASNFKDGYAIVSTLLKDSIGFNKVLNKSVISYKIEEYVIDNSGETIKYLENPLNYDSLKLKSKSPPNLRSTFIAPHLVAVLKKNQKWDIYKF